jgi:phytoene dehydrogenase-like protein
MARPDAGEPFQDRDAIVVGGGPNGLAAAVALARAGLGVIVYEAKEEAGGGTRTSELTLPGFQHDVCSSVHPMGVASPFFRELPLAAHGLTWIHPPLPAAHPFDDGTAAVLARSVGESAASLRAGDARAYRELLDPFVDAWDAVLSEAMLPRMRFPSRPLIMARMARLGLPASPSMASRQFSSERARAFLLGLAAHVGIALGRTPFAFAIALATAAHAVGWPFARGGSRRITEALEAVLRAHDGTVVTGTPVKALSDLHPARITMLDLTPKQVLALGVRFSGRYRRALGRYRYGPGVFKVDWALSEPIPWKAEECTRAGTVHLGPSPDEITAALDAAWEGRPHDTPFVILTQPSLFDPARAPARKHVAWAYCHVPNGSGRDMTDAIERQVERFAPGFREVVLDRHVMGPPDLERYNANFVGGEIVGGVSDLAQLFFRPVPQIDPYATSMRGLYLCSASTPPGGGVHGMCGFNAATSALRRMRS